MTTRFPSPAQVARDSSPAAVSAGFVAMLVGFTSTIALIFQAARLLGANPDQVSSWVLALGVGMGVGSMGLSLWTRSPILITWSTPGAAVIAAAAVSGVNLAEATGAFLVCGVLMWLSGVTKVFERAMGRIPVPLAAALLAGILAKFALQSFSAAAGNPVLVVGMLLAYLLGKRCLPRYAVMVVLAVGTLIAMAQGQVNTGALSLTMPQAVWVTPAWSWHAVIGLGLPLFIVTMASQAVPGISAIRVSGYPAPVSSLMSWSGILTLVFAPFGGYTFNLAAITAAIVLSPHAHAQPERRYTAAVYAGLFYIMMGLLGGTVVGLLAAFPPALVISVAGLALLGTIANGLAASLQDARYREAAVITFLVTLSGVTLLGISSAFWGLVAGALTLFVEHFRVRTATEADTP